MERDECYDGARVRFDSRGPIPIKGTMRLYDGEVYVAWDTSYPQIGYVYYSGYLHLLRLDEDPFDAWVRQVRAGANADNNDTSIQR